jgi:hypothetical protein
MKLTPVIVTSTISATATPRRRTYQTLRPSFRGALKARARNP